MPPRPSISWGASLGMAVLLTVLAVGSAQGSVLVTDIGFAARADGEGYVVRVRASQPVQAYSMPRSTGHHQLRWVLYNTSLDDNFQKEEPKGPIERYTVTRQNDHLVLQLHLSDERSMSASAYRDGASDDLLLNLRYRGRPPITDASSPSGSTEQQQTDAQELMSRVSRQRSRLDTIVIDPGHGGKDPGAVANGLHEKTIVLDVAKQLGQYIENRLDLEVVYTRTDDRFIALEERGHYANRVGGDLFISLHANAARARSAYGTETFFLGRSKTDAARRVMRRENSVVRRYEENPDRYDEYDEEAFVRGELFLSASMRFSERFASLVQNQFKERVHRRDRGVHQAGFYVLWSASMPSILVELGFLTNPQEARFLNSEQGQVYLASAIFRAVRKYEREYNKGIVASE